MVQAWAGTQVAQVYSARSQDLPLWHLLYVQGYCSFESSRAVCLAGCSASIDMEVAGKHELLLSAAVMAMDEVVWRWR